MKVPYVQAIERELLFKHMIVRPEEIVEVLAPLKAFPLPVDRE